MSNGYNEQKQYRKEITELKQVDIPMFMVPPLKSNRKNIQFVGDIEDDENLSISEEDSFDKQRKAKEIWIHGYQIIIAKRDMNLVKSHKKKKSKNNPYKAHFQPLLGIKFPNNEVIYMKATFYHSGGNMAGCTSDNHNIIVNFPIEGKVFMGLKERSRCEICSKPLIKVYRCYDCKPHKSYSKIDFCKACYKKRKHASHRVVALNYQEDIFDKYNYLLDLIETKLM